MSPVESVQVAIIGAGLSGLRAATEIHNAGLSYVVLEGMDRVGGKTLSVPTSSTGDAVIDLGAAWINDTTQAQMYALAQQFGFDLVPQRAEGLSIHQDAQGGFKTLPFGVPTDMTEEEQVLFHEFISKLMEYVERSDLKNPHLGPDASTLDNLTVAEFIENEFPSPIILGLATTLTRAILGVDAHEVSALYLVDFIKSGDGFVNITSDVKDGAQYLRNQQGNQTFSVRLAAKLNSGTVKLSSGVVSIEQFDDYAAICTSDGKLYHAKKIISSVPTCLLPLIKFTPTLPLAKKTLTESTKLGYYSKTVLVFSEPWWRAANLSGAYSSNFGAIAFTRDTCTPENGQFSITCFHVGETGRKWSALEDTERRRVVLEEFKAAFGTIVSEIPEPLNIIEKEWTKDPWARGNPNPVMMPGLMTSDAGQSIREPVQHVHFVGTETSYEWKGYMEGAVLSGIRGAKEVIDLLKSELM